LRPALGFCPWLAFLRRALVRLLLVFFDMAERVPASRSDPTDRDLTWFWAGPTGASGIGGAAVERFGFVGLPNSGKSSLFNALVGGGALAVPYAFATTDANVGMARIPDSRLERLGAMSRSADVVPTTVEFTDINRIPVTKHDNQDSESNRRLSRSHCENKKDKNLSVNIAQKMRKRDKINID